MIECSNNYSDTSGCLRQFKRNERFLLNCPADLSIDNSKLLKYKAALVGKKADAANKIAL